MSNIIQDIKAGHLANWLASFLESQRSGSDAMVPCGECTACCTSSYFIHIKPSDQKTMERLPKEILFPAPGSPDGHYLLGYTEKGHCPMFQEGKCSIYECRPLTCRQYDCRIFPATDLSLEHEGKPAISTQIQRWEFDMSTEQDKEVFNALRLAAAFLEAYAHLFPKSFVPARITQRAVMAIRIHDLFIGLSEQSMHEQAEKIAKSVTHQHETLPGISSNKPD